MGILWAHTGAIGCIVLNEGVSLLYPFAVQLQQVPDPLVLKVGVAVSVDTPRVLPLGERVCTT